MHHQQKDKSVLLSVPIIITTDAPPGISQPDADPPPPGPFISSNGMNGHGGRENGYGGFGFGDMPPPLIDEGAPIPSYEEVVGAGGRGGVGDGVGVGVEHGEVIIGLAQ